MKKNVKFWVSGMIALMVQSQVTLAQKIDDERMTRDIEVAENVLATLIKQEVNQQRGYFGIEIKGTYQEGYGVTFRLPGEYAMPMIMSTPGENRTTLIYSDDVSPVIAFPRDDRDKGERDKEREAYKLKEKGKEKKRVALDSVRDEYYKKLIKASRDFIVDYGDLLSQLGPNEKIVVTNQGENRSWYFKENKRIHVSIEATKGDITTFKQGKITRDQALSKLKVINTESVEVKEPDMELLASIFNRLYRPDLSTTYFSENNLYYERLKDYGVIFYMPVYSSTGDFVKIMPTQGDEEMDEATRDKKVTELYPKFEKELKENILEYGRTLKTLKDDEVLVFNVTLTKCKGCGIPATLELTLKGTVLKEFGSGKLDKNAAMTKFATKKGPNQ